MSRVLLFSLLAFGLLRAEMACGIESLDDASSLNVVDVSLAPRLPLPAIFAQKRSREAVARGQSPSTFETPAFNAPTVGVMTPFSGAAMQDPFLYGPDPVLGGPTGGTMLSGVNGPQPYRLGFTPRFDYTFLAGSSTKHPDVGQFESHNFDFELAYTTPIAPGWVLTSTPQVGARLWSGPSLVNLPNDLYRLGWDFTLAVPPAGPWSMQFNFNPSINSDFQEGLGNEALNLDGNAMLFYRASPQ